jgi:hypothetical protein
MTRASTDRREFLRDWVLGGVAAGVVAGADAANAGSRVVKTICASTQVGNQPPVTKCIQVTEEVQQGIPNCPPKMKACPGGGGS